MIDNYDGYNKSADDSDHNDSEHDYYDDLILC